ncbi:MAG: trehalose-phosphatase, partial [Bradymonadaceae bacterium]
LPGVTRRVLRKLAEICPVTIISGRSVDDLSQRVGIDGIQYAGSHGFEILDEEGRRIHPHSGEAMIPDLALIAMALSRQLARFSGVHLERSAFSLTVHRRQAPADELVEIDEIVANVLADHSRVEAFPGVEAIHIVPAVDWNEGRALEWILDRLEKKRPATAPLYLGTMPTGESAFRRLRNRGVCVTVGEDENPDAHFSLTDVREVVEFLTLLIPSLQRIVHDEGWVMRYERFDPLAEGVRESLTTLGNGYFATRGAAPEATADDVHYPGTYLAGGYDRLLTRRAGGAVENEDLVNFPNWLLLEVRIENQEWFSLRDVDILAYDQELDLKRGLMHRFVRFRDKEGRTTRMDQTRLIHMEHIHLAALQTRITAEDWSGRIEVRSALDGRVVNDNVKRYRGLQERHLQILDMGELDPETVFLRVRTTQSRQEVVQVQRTRAFYQGDEFGIIRHYIKDLSGLSGHQFVVGISEGHTVSVEKTVALYTSRDRAITEPLENAARHIHRAPSFADLLRSHVRAWKHIWRHFEIGLTSSELLPNGQPPGLILRLHVFHLVQTASPHSYDLDVGIPARGWHGEAYRGHVFWDDLFIFPLLNMRSPEITRALLLYRYRRLDEARARAAREGYRGAMFPWQSGSDGREETPLAHYEIEEWNGEHWRPELTWMQQHISAAVVYNIWRYYQVTGDTRFMQRYGGEIVFEVARFFASYAHYDEERDSYEIWGVVGPDEYHDTYPGLDTPGLRNNAYTNVLVVWVMCRALELIEILPHGQVRELFEKLELDFDEIARWEAISRKLRVIVTDEGLIMQFEGYESLEEFDWEFYRQEHGDLQKIDRILYREGKSLNHYKISKQADVLMLFYLFSRRELKALFTRLGKDIDSEMIQKNIDYYMQRTSHGSTLSRIVHSWVLSEHDPVQAWQLFSEALLSDVGDTQGGTTAEGIHLGAMAGTVDIIERSFAGIEIFNDVLCFCPNLP